MKNVVFLAHWSLAFIEEQFFALYKNICATNLINAVYFCNWTDRQAVHYLIYFLFEQTETDVLPTFENFPTFEKEQKQTSHPLENFTINDTLFVIQFNPLHLKYFLKSTGGRFPKNYVWWQIEQTGNREFLKDQLYKATIERAKMIIDFNSNALNHCPFSAANRLLSYENCDIQRLKMIRHQKDRLIQDNPRFSKSIAGKQLKNSVLLLGTCDVLRRKFFKKLCQGKIEIVHPREHNYVFAKEREEFIENFIRQCHMHSQLAISVNIHQYEESALEKAKIFLLLANGCDLVLSERSIHVDEEQSMQEICGPRLKFVNNLHEMLAEILLLQNLYEPKKYLPLVDSDHCIKAWVSVAEKMKLI